MQIIRTGGLLYVCVDAVSRTSFIDNKSELKWHKNRIKQRERVREIPDTETETERGWVSDKVGEECQQVSTGPDSQQLLTSRLMCFHYSFSWNPELKRVKISMESGCEWIHSACWRGWGNQQSDDVYKSLHMWTGCIIV